MEYYVIYHITYITISLFLFSTTQHVARHISVKYVQRFLPTETVSIITRRREVHVQVCQLHLNHTSTQATDIIAFIKTVCQRELNSMWTFILNIQIELRLVKKRYKVLSPSFFQPLICLFVINYMLCFPYFSIGDISWKFMEKVSNLSIPVSIVMRYFLSKKCMITTSRASMKDR